MLNEVVEVLWQVDLRERAAADVMVNVDHAVLWVHLHRLWEEVHELDQRLLRSGSCWVVHEDDTLSVLLDRSIALFIFQISADIPELNVDLAEVRN